MPFKNGDIPWNKGLTKETDERVREHSEVLKGRHVSPKSEFKKGWIGSNYWK